MDLPELQRHWNAFGERDPLWAILTDPARKGGRWAPDEFFATGIAEINAMMAEATSLGRPRRRRRALDFGCGVGRLTQALATHTDSVLGLDVAPSMIEQARAFNRHGDRVRYAVQPGPPLDNVASRSVDVVYTGRVLQHIAPEYSTQYIGELARITAPGGFLSFDVPGRWLDVPTMPPGALPPGAYRAGLSMRQWREAPARRLVLDVTVTNLGETTWPDGQPINLGNHWKAADGTMIVADDGRTPVPLPLAPGASVNVTLETARPENAAASVLELDVVHEGVTWFAWQGSEPVRTKLGAGLAAVEQAPSPPLCVEPAPSDADGFSPIMEMHAVPRTVVESILRQAGATLIGVRPESHCGPHWEAWRYLATVDE